MSESERLETAWRHARELAGSLDLLAGLFADKAAALSDQEAAPIAAMMALMHGNAHRLCELLGSVVEGKPSPCPARTSCGSPQ